MAKVVLVWNEHPNEIVAGHHARNCAKLLEAMGHKVVLEKYPTDETAFAIMRKGTPGQAAANLKDKIQKGAFTGRDVLQKYRKRHNAMVFSFHSASPEILGESEKAEANKFRVGIMTPEIFAFHFPHEILFVPYKEDYNVEVPAIYHELSAKTLKKAENRMDEINKIAKDSSVRQELDWDHQVTINKIRQPDQQKYLDPVISKKIAKAIDEIISNKAAGKRKETA